MDFSYSEDQRALIDLADQILKDNATHERLREIEKSGGPRFDPKLWKTLADAGLIGASLPEAIGGAGLGFLEATAVLEKIGRYAAPVPYLEVVVAAGLTLAEFADAKTKNQLLPKIISGELIIVPAVQEEHVSLQAPKLQARPDGDGFVLSGEKICVPYAEVADAFLVSANIHGSGPALFLVDASAGGLERTTLDTTSGIPESDLRFESLRLDSESRIGDGSRDRQALDWLVERTTAGQCALLLGVCESALELTSEYTKTREQFGQPLAMFQAVGHRAADAYIDTEAVRLTTLQAVWRIDAGMPAAAEVALAKYWGAEGGQRVVHAAQHLHGGMGVDRDYPLHRYFLYAKHLELALGGATEQLLKIGEHLAISGSEVLG